MQRIGIVGGGAAGLFCAAYLAYYTSYPITIYEKNNRVGKKLLVTGNGKCNLSNIHWHSCVYNHPQIMDLIASFDVEKTRDFFKKIGLLTKVDSNGRVYPYSETATSVLETLRQFLIQKKVTFICDCFIKAIENKQHYFILKSCSQTYQEDYVILSTGGLAYYQKSNSYTLLSSFNHTVTPLSPSLTGIKTIEKLDSIANIRCKAKVSLWVNHQCQASDQGEVLFKKDGLSGIVIFQISHFVNRFLPYQKQLITLDLMPEYDMETLTKIFEQIKEQNLDLLQGIFPKMLANYVYQQASSLEIKDLILTIKQLPFHIQNLDSYDHAQITSGGAVLDEIHLSSMESKRISHLYLIGEIVDVDGLCGGYNLQWAWTSAALCAINLRKEEKNEKKET